MAATAYAALVSLMNNIHQIQRHTRLPISLDKKQSESLLEKVNFLIDFLEGYDYSRRVSQEMEDLESRIRDAAYAAEDIIETHVVDTIHDHSRSDKEENDLTTGLQKAIETHVVDTIHAHSRSIKTKKNPTCSCLSMRCLRLYGLFKKNPTVRTKASRSDKGEKNPILSCLDKVMEEMDFIKEDAMKLKVVEDPRPSNPITGPLISLVPAVKNIIVGFDDELKQITERLLARQPSRQVIPIVGMGGMGKTTLVKTAYQKPLIRQQFDICAWVTISQEYNLRQIIVELLGKEFSEMSDIQLGETLLKTLNGRRYLVVLDDMWSVKAWEMVKQFLPDISNRSRIIVTTRLLSVSTCFGSSILEMNFLDDDKSWILFCKRVFGHEDCPPELEEVGRKIVKNCRGLPLAISTIGGLLAMSKRRNEYWEKIVSDMSAVNVDRIPHILSLSYRNLSIHLKPCFLYMGFFPEDEEISVSWLIKLWIGEGFCKDPII